MTTAIDQNLTYASHLGWLPQDFGAHAFDAALVDAIKTKQGEWGLAVDGIAGPRTYGMFWTVKQTELRKSPSTLATDKLADAGKIAFYEGMRYWCRNIIDLPQKGSAAYAISQQAIDQMIRTPVGLGWSWQPPYDANIKGAGNFEWCGAFAASCWAAAGLLYDWRYRFWASTYRLDAFARYQMVDHTAANPKPVNGPRRMVIELDETSNTSEVRFSDGTLPRTGDILLVGPRNSAYGKHITLIERYHEGSFQTVEGNGFGRAPAGDSRQGVIRAVRHLGMGLPPTAYHARRVIRLAVTDLA